MSVRIMTQIWDRKDLGPIDKLALLALADWANDDGLAWPSISQIAVKTGCSERTVHRAFRKAEEMGILTKETVAGKGCKYTIDPCHSVTPDTVSPLTQCHTTPDTVSPNTSRNTNLDKPDGLSKARARKTLKQEARNFVPPHWIPKEAWDGYIDMRDLKGAYPSMRAINLIISKLDEMRRSGMDPGAVLDQSTVNNWTGIFKLRGDVNERNCQNPEEPTNPMVRAVIASQAKRAAGRGGGTGGGSEYGGSSEEFY